MGSLLFRLVDVVAEDVAERSNLDRGGLLEQGHYVLTPFSWTDHSQDQPVVRAENAGIGSRGESGCALRRTAQKIAPGKKFRHSANYTAPPHYLSLAGSSHSGT